MSQEPEKFYCKDCVHCSVAWHDRTWPVFGRALYTFAKCRKSYQDKVIKEDLVAGPKIKKGDMQYCSSFRIGPSEPGNCGKGAYYWQPKNKKDLFKLIKKECTDERQ